MLYLVSTPIGNLEDITLRALCILQECSYILAEDTRTSRILLDHFKIKKPLKSYHRFNEAKKLEEILRDLREGLEIALISDAGTPGIADPGERLVVAALEEGLAVTAIPGPCALIAALSLSGLSSCPFQFLGFLPKKGTKTLQSALSYPGTTLFYESPHRLLKTLKALHLLAPLCRVVIAREMTKKFEEILRGTPDELLASFEGRTVKGEIVLLLSSCKDLPEDFVPEEEVLRLQQEEHLSKKEAVKQVSKQCRVPKRALYKKVHKPLQ